MVSEEGETVIVGVESTTATGLGLASANCVKRTAVNHAQRRLLVIRDWLILYGRFRVKMTL